MRGAAEGDAVTAGRIIRVALIWQALGLLAWLLTPAVRFLVMALFGSGLLLLLAEPAWRRAARTGALGAAFGLVWAAGHPDPLQVALAHPTLPMALLGLGALGEFGLHPATDDTVTLAGFGIPLFVFGIALALGPISHAQLFTRDAVLLEADRSLGGLPSYAMATAIGGRPLLAAASWFAYVTLPIEVCVVTLVAIRRALPDMRPRRILLACATAGLAAAVLYLICPATGPRYAFPGFPAGRPGPLPLAGMVVSAEFPRNAMPSLHLAWAWMLHHAARPVAWLRYATLAWLAGVALATLWTGEHYLIDLVVAVPFVAAVEAGLARALRPALLAGVATLGWVVFLGTAGGLSPEVAWPAVGVTLALGVWAMPRTPYAETAPLVAGS